MWEEGAPRFQASSNDTWCRTFSVPPYVSAQSRPITFLSHNRREKIGEHSLRVFSSWRGVIIIGKGAIIGAHYVIARWFFRVCKSGGLCWVELNIGGIWTIWLAMFYGWDELYPTKFVPLSLLLVSSWWWSHPLDIQHVSDEYTPYIMTGSSELVIHRKQSEINAN
jgi:hypothetical protein